MLASIESGVVGLSSFWLGRQGDIGEETEKGVKIT
jgi:hypothetical protein